MSDSDYHAEVQELRAELERLRGLTRPTVVPDEKPKRISPTEILRSMLATSEARAKRSDHSSARLTRGMTGNVGIEVLVATGEAEDVATPELAAAKAQAIFDMLDSFYPVSAKPTEKASKGAREDA